MSNANPHTTMSFMPIDRDLILACSPDCKVDESFTLISPFLSNFAMQSNNIKNRQLTTSARAKHTLHCKACKQKN